MAHSTAVLSTVVPAPPALAARELLYKADHPRVIDRYIDFFGDGLLADADPDGCGERLLESLA